MDREAGATRYALTVLTYLLAVTTYAVSNLFESFFLILSMLGFGFLDSVFFFLYFVSFFFFYFFPLSTES